MARKILNNLETYGVIRNKINDNFTDLYTNKIDKVEGMGLSTNDYTTDDKDKLESIEFGANKYIHPNDVNTRHVTDTEKEFWNGKSDFSGDYNDLLNLPSVLGDMTSDVYDPQGKAVDIFAYADLQSEGKVDKTSIVQTDTVNDSAKIPSSAVTYTLGQEIDTINDKLANKFPIVEGDFTPGGNIIIVGKLDEGFMGFVRPSEMGKINGTEDYNGANLALAIGLASGTAFNSNVPLMKFHSKGKVLFIPLTGYRHSCPWDKIYEAGAVYGTNDEGLLPPTGRLGTDLSINGNDNSINCTNQRFLGDKTAAQEYADTVGAVGDTLVLKGWGEANNKTVTIVSITNTKIVVSGATLVTEQGGKTSRFYNQSKAVNQNKIVPIGGKQYRVRLMKGSGANPTDSINNVDRGAAGADNEWNSLILPLHEQAKLGNWIYPQYAVDKDGEIIISDWGIGLTDENLRTHNQYGSGSYTWCQETIDSSTWMRVFRGYLGASYSLHNHSWSTSSNSCWRPVLESL